MPRTLVMVLAGGAGSRLGPLTDGRAGADARVGRAGGGITVTGRGAEVAAGTEFATEEEQ